ncbi:DUF4870 domain-containing protein [Natrialbaceae archaeon A-arb3/5]
MSDERDPTPATPPSDEPGPSLLTERTLLGIFIHPVALLTGFFGPAFVYFLTEHEFTQANARNALNWHLFYTGAWLIMLGAMFGWMGVVELTPIPDVIALVMFVGLFITLLVVMLLMLLGLVFTLLATAKAIFGTAWEYPIAPDLTAWIGSYWDR